jgi:hypothetical protein
MSQLVIYIMASISDDQNDKCRPEATVVYEASCCIISIDSERGAFLLCMLVA